MNSYDVIVIGGGSAGVIAATQAGRAGAKTLLVEKSSRLGGTIINAGINRPGLFHAWGKQIIAGIGWELVEKTIRLAGDPMLDFADTTLKHFQYQPTVDPLIFAALCDEFVLESGCEMLLHTMIASANFQNDHWEVELCEKTGLRKATAKQLIDCTGDANVVSLAGLPVNAIENTQPASLDCTLAGYEPADVDMEAIDRAFCDAIAGGRVKASDGCWRIDTPGLGHFLGKKGRNANHIVIEQNAHDSMGRTVLEVEGRRSVLRMINFLKEQPGFENVRVADFSIETGVRETVTIQGKTTVTLDDYQSGKVWDDAVCNTFYPIDLHGIDSDSWEFKPLPEGIVATIPRGALLPAGSSNLLVAGRSVSSDRYANSAIRVQAPCMAMGQAAAALAVIAANNNCDPQEVAMEELRQFLREYDAIVP